MIKRFNAQFAYPQGWISCVVGMILALKNYERKAWTISMLDLKPDNQVIEVGFRPG